MRLIIIRHAEAQGNPEGRMLGRAETDLTAVGLQQARLLHQKFQRQARQLDYLYSSPQERAVQTTHCFNQGQPLRICKDLCELDQGILTNLTWAEACTRYPDLCASTLR